MPLIIDLQATYERGEDPSAWDLDLSESDGVFAIVVGLGNGIFDELRAVGNSKEALINFIYLIKAGGYNQYSKTHHLSKKLYHAGDLSFPESDPVVFISLQTSDGDTLSLTEVDALLVVKEMKTSTTNQTQRKTVKDLNDLRVSPTHSEDRPLWKFW